MSENIKELGKQKKFPVCAELYSRIEALIHEYDGEIGVAEAIGVLEMVKHGILSGQQES